MTPVKLTPIKVITSERASFFKKFNKVLEATGYVQKRGYNSHHKYYYTTEADLINEVRPLLVKHGLSLNIKASDYIRNGSLTTVKMSIEIVDIDTGWGEVSVFYGEGQDSQDKGIYKAYTGAMKYFLMKSLLIPTGNDPEEDAGHGNGGSGGAGEVKMPEVPKGGGARPKPYEMPKGPIQDEDKPKIIKELIHPKLKKLNFANEKAAAAFLEGVFGEPVKLKDLNGIQLSHLLDTLDSETKPIKGGK